jgi:arylformamidase
MPIFDLSQPFDSAHQSGSLGSDPAALRVEALKTVAEDGLNSLKITFGNHQGTHIDAPLHLIEGGTSVDGLPASAYCGSAVVIVVPKRENEGVTVVDLLNADPAIVAGDIVVLCTGWGDRAGTPEYASHHPFLTEEAARWLVNARVRLVGMDVQSVDLPHSLRPPGFRYTSLRTLLSAGIPVLHSLANLEAIAGKRVQIFCAPINFTGADGAPARVVAEV